MLKEFDEIDISKSGIIIGKNITVDNLHLYLNVVAHFIITGELDVYMDDYAWSLKPPSKKIIEFSNYNYNIFAEKI
jgi:hypothetical protein